MCVTFRSPDSEQKQNGLDAVEQRLARLMLWSAAVGFLASMGFFSTKNPVVQEYCGIAAIAAVVVFFLAWGAYCLYNRARNKANKTDH